MITIPTGNGQHIQIPPQEKTTDEVERIGVSADVAAKMIGVSTRTIWNLINAGQIRCVKLGKRSIISVQSLRELIDDKPCE